MASGQRKATRGASAAARRAAEKRAEARRAAKEAEEAKPFEEELTVALGHQQALDAQFSQLSAQRDQINAQLEDVRMRAHQAFGRISTLRELRGEAPPLPPVALLGQPDADGAAPEEPVEGSEKAD